MHIWLKKQAMWQVILFTICTTSVWAQFSVPKTTPSDSITFDADQIFYDIQTKQIELIGNAKLHYRNIELEAGHIIYDQDNRQVTAQALPDSTGAKTIGQPKFVRDEEQLTGEHMVYNLDTERGNVRTGRAKYERKYYKGDHILLDGQKALNALDLSLSTCDRDHMHYDFLCKNVRILQNDKAIGRSVTFRIGPVPLFWVPFFVFPVKQGRQSGLLTPGIGSNTRDGIFVRNLGYYFAPSEYWDATLKGTFRERGGFLLESNFRYATRNRFSGAIDIGYDRNTSGLNTAHNWRLNVSHQQRINATTNIRGNGQFSTSTSFDRRNSNDLYSYLNQQLRSSFSIDKRWPDAGRNVDGSITYYRDLKDKTNSFQGFPRLSFNQTRRQLFGDAETINPAWYHAFYYGFSSTLANTFTRNPGPSDENPNPRPNTERFTVLNRASLNSQHRPMGWLDLTPSFNLSEEFIHTDQDSTTRNTTYSAAITSGTIFYGIFQPQIGRLRGIRHRFQPRINFNYNQSGKVLNGSFGIGGRRDWGKARRTINFNIGNTIELKTQGESDVHRFTLATLNFTTGYDFDSPTQKWRTLNTNASLKPDRRVDMRINMNHKLYDKSGNRSLLHPRLQDLTITSNFRFSGNSTQMQDNTLQSSLFQDYNANYDSGFGFERDLYGDFSNTTDPWRFNLSHHIAIRRDGTSFRKTSWIKADVGLNPILPVIDQLRIDYSINVDILPDAKLSAQSLNIHRDLHCWETRFSWYPTGFNKGFFFKVNIKEIPQIKFEHRRGGFGI